MTGSNLANGTENADPRDRIFDTAHMQDGLGRQVGRASVFLLAISLVRTVQQIAAIAIVARLIPPSEYGIFAMALPGVMLAVALSNLGLPQAVVQKKEITHREVSALLWLNVTLAVTVIGVLVVFAGPIAAWYGAPEVAPVLRVVSFAVLFSALLGQYVAILRRTLRVRSVEYVSLGAELAGLVIVVTAALMGLSYWALVMQQIAIPALSLLGLIYVTRWGPSLPSAKDMRAARGSVAFGGSIAGFSIANRMTEYAGTVVAGASFAAAGAGIFYRAQNLALMAQRKVMVPLSGAFVPTLSRLQDAPEDMRAMAIRLYSRSALIMAPIAVGLAVAAEPLTLILLGPDWAELAPLLFWFSLFVLRAAGNMAAQQILVASGKGAVLLGFGLFRMVLVTLAMVVAARWGMVAMAATAMLVELLVTFPVLAALAVRHTALSWSALWAASLREMGLAVGIAAALIWGFVPFIAGWGALAQVVACAGVIAVIYVVRIGVSPALRADLRQVVRRRSA